MSTGRRLAWGTALDRWIEGAYPTSADALGVGRVLFAGCLLLVTGVPNRLWLDALPDFVFDPRPGLGSLFGAFPPAWLLHLLRWLTCIFTLAVALGHRTRAASLGLGLALIATFAFEGRLASGGPVFLMLFPLVMAYSNWGASLSLDAVRRDWGAPRAVPDAAGPARQSRGVAVWPIAYLSLLLGFMMWTAGAVKLSTDWLDPSLASRGHFLRTQLAYGRDALLAPWMLSHAPMWLWQIADFGTVLLEVGFLLAVPWPRVFRLFCAGAIFFHTGILLVMNIDYSVHLPLYAVFFLGALDTRRGLHGWVGRWEARLAGLRWVGWPGLALVAAAWCLALPAAGSPTTLLLGWFGVPPTPHRGLVLLLPACALALLHLVGRLRDALAPRSLPAPSAS